MRDLAGFELLTRAHIYLSEVAAAVPERAWGSPTPCSEWTVRQVLNHARLDQRAYGAAITGTGWPDSDPFPARRRAGRRRADGAGEGAAGRGGRLRATAGRLPEVATPLGPLPFRWPPPLLPPWTPPCTPGTSPSPPARTRRWRRGWRRGSGLRRIGSPIICATRTGCSPPPERCRRPPAGRRRCSPSSAGTRTGRPPCPDLRTERRWTPRRCRPADATAWTAGPTVTGWSRRGRRGPLSPAGAGAAAGPVAGHLREVARSGPWSTSGANRPGSRPGRAASTRGSRTP